MATLGAVAGVTARSSRSPSAVTGAAAMRASMLQPMNLFATIQGQRTLEEHLFTLTVVLPPIMQALVGYFGVILAETAKEIHLKNVDTGDTYRSIKTGSVIPLPSGGAVNVSVSTPQAKFLEFGFIHHLSGKWIHNPFMIPAADVVTPMFVDAVEQAAQIAGNLRLFRGPASVSPANDILQTIRGSLYSYSKFAGDIQVLGFTGLSKTRGLAIKGSQGIGHIQAARAGTVVGRVSRVVAGRFGSRYGREGIMAGFGSGAAFAGPTARIYNRVSGRIFGKGLGKIR